MLAHVNNLILEFASKVQYILNKEILAIKILMSWAPVTFIERKISRIIYICIFRNLINVGLLNTNVYNPTCCVT